MRFPPHSPSARATPPRPRAPRANPQRRAPRRRLGAATRPRRRRARAGVTPDRRGRSVRRRDRHVGRRRHGAPGAPRDPHPWSVGAPPRVAASPHARHPPAPQRHRRPRAHVHRCPAFAEQRRALSGRDAHPAASPAAGRALPGMVGVAGALRAGIWRAVQRPSPTPPTARRRHRRRGGVSGAPPASPAPPSVVPAAGRVGPAAADAAAAGWRAPRRTSGAGGARPWRTGPPPAAAGAGVRAPRGGRGGAAPPRRRRRCHRCETRGRAPRPAARGWRARRGCAGRARGGRARLAAAQWRRGRARLAAAQGRRGRVDARDRREAATRCIRRPIRCVEMGVSRFLLAPVPVLQR